MRKLVTLGLRRVLDHEDETPARERQAIRVTTVNEGLPPGLDVSDRSAMNDGLRMRQGAGLSVQKDPPSERAPIGTALDRFVGVWSRNEEREFLRSIQDVEKIDPELWD